MSRDLNGSGLSVFTQWGPAHSIDSIRSRMGQFPWPRFLHDCTDKQNDEACIAHCAFGYDMQELAAMDVRAVHPCFAETFFSHTGGCLTRKTCEDRYVKLSHQTRFLSQVSPWCMCLTLCRRAHSNPQLAFHSGGVSRCSSCKPVGRCSNMVVAMLIQGCSDRGNDRILIENEVKIPALCQDSRPYNGCSKSLGHT